jgi:hypothetical protein
MLLELQFKHYFYKKIIMGFLRQIGEYLYIVKRDPKQERTGMMKAMHGMNRISLIVFLIGIIVILVRKFTH